jgi:formylglycine-generating enzyme required for sulfatase activity
MSSISQGAVTTRLCRRQDSGDLGRFGAQNTVTPTGVLNASPPRVRAGDRMSERRARRRNPQRSTTSARRHPRSLRRVIVAVVVIGTAAALALTMAQSKPMTTGTRAMTTASGFFPTRENRTRPPGTAPDGMVWVPGGEFSMGAADPTGIDGNDVGMHATDDSRPIHRVYVDGFWMDATVVTNGQFAAFVDATGYVTVAERTPRAEDFPGAPLENLVAGSVVFSPPQRAVRLDDHLQWWSYVRGANWRHPLGPGTSIAGQDAFPVVHVAYDDARAYLAWAGKRLPTEAEWEFAARGGLTGQAYAWGNEFRPAGKWMANTHQGHFPDRDAGDDGFAGLAPVAQFPPNGYGLFDVAGNVWEWVGDWYRPDYYAQLAADGGVVSNPQGPVSSFDPAEPRVRKRVMRGGSFLCTDQYCSRYMVGTRGKGDVDTGTNHLGFRSVISPLRATTP